MTKSKKNAGEWLLISTDRLKTAGIETARLDCLVLLEDVMQKERAVILAHPEMPITEGQVKRLSKQASRRATHEPLAYIRRKAPFYGREFLVNKRVLVPRPESEAMIDLLKALPLTKPVSIADIGAGSGCLGVTAALEIPDSAVNFYDIDSGALATATRNARMYGVRGQYYCTNLLKKNSGPYTIIIANLPYVPDHYAINTSSSFEPKLALNGGSDGLDVYKSFWHQIGMLEWSASYIITEAFPEQHHAIALLARACDYNLIDTSGFAQVFELGFDSTKVVLLGR